MKIATSGASMEFSDPHHQMPLDFSSPPQEILDLCVRRDRGHTPPVKLGVSRHEVLLEGLQSTGYHVAVPALTMSSQVLSTTTRSNKPTRPFKAYPKDPLCLAAETLLGGEASSEAYLEFRRKMLEQVHAVTKNCSSSRVTGQIKRSASPQQPSSTEGNTGEECKDAAYWERRRKNNEAAKRSRDARRAKEDEIAIRAAFLEQENMKLKYEVAALRSETAKLRCLLYNTRRPNSGVCSTTVELLVGNTVQRDGQTQVSALQQLSSWLATLCSETAKLRCLLYNN
uniref:BZIP domain-containing protein n=1 Tax=Timema cristinae TaxID=61476 RepID=A0A7R9DBU9_TIMCR|nr:unnamed protein product [Timema cristinae]